MTRIIISGINGHMGRVLESLAADDNELSVAAGVDPFGDAPHDFPVFKSLSECNVAADVVVDFSSAKGTDELLAACVEKHIPLVLCTTGLSEEQLSRVKEAEKEIAILRSANMSLGINTLIDLLKKASKVFCPAGFDAEVLEAHHDQKVDAPSGTALALADAVKEGSGIDYDYVYDRSTRREKRPKKEIGIASIRGGNIVGEHEVFFCGTDEVITFKHQATSKAVFAKGALEAAKFLNGKPAGAYDMSDVIAAK